MKPYEYSQTVSVKMPIHLLKKIDEKNKKRSESIIEYLKLGIEIESLIEISKDPEKKLQFETDLENLLKQDSIEHTLETLDDKTLNGILFYANALKERRFKQELISIR